MKLSKKFIFYICFFAVLVTAFYIFALKDYDFGTSSLKVINDAVPAFSFTDQDGKKISQHNTDDKVYVANYFFTTCRGICPKMNANLRLVYDAFKDEPDFLILSHTCMPEIDSMPLLKAYEEKMVNGKLIKTADGNYTMSAVPETGTAVNKNWFFLTGDKKELYKLARTGYIIDNGDSTGNISNQFIHTQFFSLVDRYRRVRGIYDGLNEKEVLKMIEDIKGLLKEKVDHTRFLNGFSNSPT